jgi:hypothetical protein
MKDERESTQNTTVTKSAAFASYKIKVEKTLLLVKMKQKNLLKIQPLPKVLRVQASYTYIHHDQAIHTYIMYVHTS